MNQKMKKSFLVAALLCGAGLVLFLICLLGTGFDFRKMSNVTYETNTYEVSDTFTDIKVDVSTADVCFVPADTDSCKVVCKETDQLKHSVRVENGTLVIDVVDQRNWINFIGFTVESPKVTVYLPETEYSRLNIKGNTGDVKVPEQFRFVQAKVEVDTGDVLWSAPVTTTLELKADTGDVTVSNVVTEALTVKTSTGDATITTATVSGALSVKSSTGEIKITDAQCKTLRADSNTGDIKLKTVEASEQGDVTSDTGDVLLNGFDAAYITIKTDTGDVEGTILSEKTFFAESDTGDVDVPRMVSEEICEITTDTGDIDVQVR